MKKSGSKLVSFIEAAMLVGEPTMPGPNERPVTAESDIVELAEPVLEERNNTAESEVRLRSGETLEAFLDEIANHPIDEEKKIEERFRMDLEIVGEQKRGKRDRRKRKLA